MNELNKDNGFDLDLSKAEQKSRWAEQEIQRLSEIAEGILKRARERGASQADVSASIHAGLSATVRMGEVETLEYSRDRGVGITVYFGQRKGGASSADLSPGSIDESLDMACSIARLAEPDPCHGLADPEQMATEPVELDGWHPWEIAPDQAIELATRCEHAALGCDPLIKNSEGATVSSGSTVAVFANSHGFVGSRRATRHSASCVVLAQSDDSMQRDYWYDTRRCAADLQDMEEIGLEAGRRAVQRHGARPVETATVPVLFLPETGRSLLGHLVGGVSGANLYRRSSFLVDRAGEQLFPDHIQIREHPFQRRGLRSCWYDGEGVATRERSLIEDGVLTGYVLGSYSARKLGLSSTGNSGGVHNLTLEPASQSRDDLLAQMGRGLVVGELMGQGVHLVTGDYSRGASGFWVEDGRIAYPVEGVTIAGNLEQMFKGIVGVGNDLDDRAALRSPSILIDRMTVAGQ